MRTTVIGVCCVIVLAAGCKHDANEKKEPQHNAALTKALREEMHSLPEGVQEMTCWGTKRPFLFRQGSTVGSATCSITLTEREAKAVGRPWYLWNERVKYYSAWDDGWPSILPEGFDIVTIDDSGLVVTARPSSDGQLDAYVRVQMDRLSLEEASAFILQVMPRAAAWASRNISDDHKNAPDTLRRSWGQ
ncbi:TPA: hypothetical protein ACUNF5_007287 [Burkholderia orbicola]